MLKLFLVISLNITILTMKPGCLKHICIYLYWHGFTDICSLQSDILINQETSQVIIHQYSKCSSKIQGILIALDLKQLLVSYSSGQFICIFKSTVVVVVDIWEFCLIKIYICLCCTFVPGIHSCKMRYLIPLDLKLQTVVSCYVGAGNQTWAV